MSALAKWVSQQRAQQAQGRLSADRKAKLDAIDFSWHLNAPQNRNTKTEDTKWLVQYNRLKTVSNVELVFLDVFCYSYWPALNTTFRPVL
jgi:hypothetical protein